MRDALRLSPHLLRGQRGHRVRRQLQVSRKSQRQQQRQQEGKVEKAAAETLKA